MRGSRWLGMVLGGVLGASALSCARGAKPGDDLRVDEPVATLDAGADEAAAQRPTKRRPRSIELAALAEEASWLVADGYLPREAIVDELLAATAWATLRPDVVQLVDRAFADHRRLEATWQGPTDPDRLARAFAALEREGVVARERLADCAACARAELEALREPARGAKRAPRGYVYFTDADVDGVSDTHELTLTVGAFDGDDDAIADRVVAVLGQHHLAARRDDEGASVVRLEGLDWKKRRFSRAP